MKLKETFTVLVLILTFIGYKYNSQSLHDVLMKEQKISAEINIFKNNIYSLDKETLKLSFFLYNNYDDINRLINKLEKQTNTLDSKILHNLINEKISNIYHFEILNSPLKNSIFYILLLNKQATTNIKNRIYLKKLNDTIFDMIVLKSVNDKLILEKFLEDYDYFKNYRSSIKIENLYNKKIIGQLKVFKDYYVYYKKFFNAIFDNDKIFKELSLIHKNINIKLNEKKLSFSIFAILLQAILFITLFSLLYFIKKFNDEHKKLKIISKTDKLTGLLNRNSFDNDKTKLYSPILFLINIDNFKHFNELYGAEVGDHILHEMAQVLKNIDIGHKANYYRLGGDDFGILINSDTIDIEKISKKILDEISNTKISYNQLIFEIGVSIGISAETPLFQNADIALKNVKSDRNLNYFIYNKHYGEKTKIAIKNNLEKIDTLKECIKNNSIEIYLQPLVELKTDKIVRYEALSRINDKGQTNSIYPYLKIAKTSKIYIDISIQIIKKCFLLLETNPNLHLSINLSIQDILSTKVNRVIFDFLGQNTMNMGKRVTFELLESEMIEDFDAIEEFIVKVKSHGVLIAIDDFGSGYSNFEYLVKLHTDILKIDGSLIDNIHINKNNHLIVKHISKLSKELGITTVAEFVSNQEIIKTLKELDIDLVQGYKYGKPFDAKELNHPKSL